MNELQMILEAFELGKRSGKTALLATLVKVKGSTYRRPGARMLMTQEDRMVGTLSGGCLEKDVFECAKQVMLSGEPTVVKYDTTAEEDIVWGLGLGCNGVVEVLVESLDVESKLNPLLFIAQCLFRKQQGILVTVFHVEGQVNVNIGDRIMLNSDGTVTCDIEDPTLKWVAIADAQAALRNEQSFVKTYWRC